MQAIQTIKSPKSAPRPARRSSDSRPDKAGVIRFFERISFTTKAPVERTTVVPQLPPRYAHPLELKDLDQRVREVGEW